MQQHQPTGRLARWIMELKQQHDFEMRYRKGTLNRVADALSRQPLGATPNLTDDDFANGGEPSQSTMVPTEASTHGDGCGSPDGK